MCRNVTNSIDFRANSALTCSQVPPLPGTGCILTNTELKTAVNDAIAAGNPVNDIDVGAVTDFDGSI